jgi:asparagine synthase (glutamine-hydrolysing)
MITEWDGGNAIVVNSSEPSSLLTERHRWPTFADPVAGMMALDAMTYLPDDILVKVDRSAMAVSLESRAPLLDRDVVEFALTLPMNLKIREGRGKWVLRQLLYRYVPPALVDRPKMGFSVPLDAWLRGPLRDWADDLLSEFRLKQEGFFNPQPIRLAWTSHIAGNSNHGHRLWSVLMFQSWLAAQR